MRSASPRHGPSRLHRTRIRLRQSLADIDYKEFLTNE
jgi:hypothetical protein